MYGIEILYLVEEPCKEPFFLNLSQTTNFRQSHTVRVCRRQFYEFDENGKKFAQMCRKTVGKGEIARYEQFLLFP